MGVYKIRPRMNGTSKSRSFSAVVVSCAVQDAPIFSKDQNRPFVKQVIFLRNAEVWGRGSLPLFYV